MALQPQSQLGTFTILGALGAGGMGEVYRARDTKLQRDVAIKVLPDEFARDTDRLHRFRREAELLAQLNHPRIAAIHDLQESQDACFLVLELVEGETLADRIGRGQLPVNQALEIAKQICEALEAAHEKGIVHRDLKPANIKLQADGTIKVLDFGLAKTTENTSVNSNLTNSPTMFTVAGTKMGLIMGTAPYMAPEQANGFAVDHRVDIFAFGCVLYEMLTGAVAFGGSTTSEILASVLKSEPDWARLPAALNPELVELLHRCLAKDRKQRWQAIGDVRYEIARIEARSASRPTSQPGSRKGSRALSTTLGAAVLLLVGAVTWLGLRPTPSAQRWTANMLGGPSFAMGPRVSPDGRLVAFMAWNDGTSQVAVTTPESGDWTVLTHDRTRGYLSNVSWSRDGTKIYYGRIDGVPRGIFAVPALGGEEHLVLEDAQSPEALADGSLLALRTNQNRQSQLFRFWPETGELKAYAAFPLNPDFAVVRVSHDGKTGFFWGRATEQASEAYALQSIDLESGKVQRLSNVQMLDRYPGALSVGPDDRTILVETGDGDLYNVVAVSRDNTTQPRPLFSTTNGMYSLDTGPDGSVYIDQTNRPTQVLRLSAAATSPELVFASSAEMQDVPSPPLPDGQILVTKIIGGKRRLLISKFERDEAIPFLQTKEETSAPTALLKNGEFAFVIGSGGARKLAVGSLKDGRIIRRLTKVDATSLSTLAASPDGQTLYYVTDHKVRSVPSVDGEPRVVHDGDAVAVDPNGKYLVIQLQERGGVRLVRVPLDGSPEQALSFPDARLAYITTPNAIRSDGVIIHTLAFGAFNWGLGLLHPESGKTERIPIDSSFDVHFPGFLPDGRIVVSGFLFNSSIWRFKPAVE